MANFCHQCAATLSPIMKVCPNCGTRVGALDARPQQVATAQRYAPPRIPGAFDPPPIRAHAYDPSVPFAGGALRHYPKASFGSRLAAWLIDGVVQLSCLVPGAVGMAMGGAAHVESMIALGGAAFGLGVLYSVWYYFTRDGRPGGAGIGKRRMGLMVVYLPTQSPATRGQSALRGLVSILVNCVPVVGTLIEPVMIIANSEGRRLADFAVSTQVVSVDDYLADLDEPDEDRLR